jgi:hypothetical protein
MTSTDDPILLGRSGRSLIAPRNLSNYWHAMATCSDEVFERLWDKCYIIEHREHTIPPQAVTLRAKDRMLRNGRTYYAPTTRCRQVPCQRCEEGRGGFRFPWCGNWTTDNCIGDRLIFEAELAVARTPPPELAVLSTAPVSSSNDEEDMEVMRADTTMTA